jgi:hypothetical protein
MILFAQNRHEQVSVAALQQVHHADAITIRELIERIHSEKIKRGDLIGRERVGRLFMTPETILRVMEQIITDAALARGYVSIHDFTRAGFTVEQARSYSVAAYERAIAVNLRVAHALAGPINLLGTETID